MPRISEVARSLRSVQQWPLKLPPCSLRLAVFTLPPATLGKLYKGEVFNESEQEMANVCLPFPKSACLIFPSIDAVREILRQHPRNDRTPRSTTKSPGCARALKIALNFDLPDAGQGHSDHPLAVMGGRKGLYDPRDSGGFCGDAQQLTILQTPAATAQPVLTGSHC
jgi:hypothetical protein